MRFYLCECCHCGIDADFDPDCFVDPGSPMPSTVKYQSIGAILCEKCRRAAYEQIAKKQKEGMELLDARFAADVHDELRRARKKFPSSALCFAGSYRNFRDAVSVVVSRCKLRSSFQNSFIETDDLLELARLTGTKIGDLYRLK